MCAVSGATILDPKHSAADFQDGTNESAQSASDQENSGKGWR